MTLAEISASFLAFIRANKSSSPLPRPRAHEQAVLLLKEYFSSNITLNEITPTRLRDFLGRWYVEKALTSKEPNPQSAHTNPVSTAATTEDVSQELDTAATTSNVIPRPGELLDSLAQLFSWVDQQAGDDDKELAKQLTSVLVEFRHSLPRALEITNVLSRWLRQRRGAFSFPEFLTSFEEGGHSEYDIDTPGSVGALEGYFKILRVEGLSVEAEELISEERVWPIVFPTEVASLLDDQYIINLELVRSPAGWQLAGCGFAYPPVFWPLSEGRQEDDAERPKSRNR